LNPYPISPGDRFGRLVVLQRGEKTYLWLCLCDCGNTTVTRAGRLRAAHTRSCGCLVRDVTAARNTKHGACVRGKAWPEYRVWKRMVERCHDPRDKDYRSYGGRGIVVCERWRSSFQAFIADMGRRPGPPRHSIERAHNDGPYAPDNCRWATRSEQDRNRRNSRLITALGRTLTLAEWARETGVYPATISVRIKKLGWTAERAVLTPVPSRRGASWNGQPLEAR
jgi:hypothetical protein